MRRLSLLSVCLTVTSCATASMTTKKNESTALLAEKTLLQQPPPAEISPNARASDYLAMGLTFFNANQRVDAINAFTRAIATGDLNNQGRALAYWHLFLSHRDDALNGQGAEALASFITVSRSLLQQAKERFDDEDLLEHVQSFIDRFDLRDRLLLAEVTLEAVWAQRDGYYGRSPDRPVMLTGTRAQRLFLHVFRPCSDEMASDKAEVQFSRAAFLVKDNIVDQATIRCPGTRTPVSLFFSGTH